MINFVFNGIKLFTLFEHVFLIKTRQSKGRLYPQPLYF